MSRIQLILFCIKYLKNHAAVPCDLQTWVSLNSFCTKYYSSQNCIHFYKSKASIYFNLIPYVTNHISKLQITFCNPSMLSGTCFINYLLLKVMYQLIRVEHVSIRIYIYIYSLQDPYWILTYKRKEAITKIPPSFNQLIRHILHIDNQMSFTQLKSIDIFAVSK